MNCPMCTQALDGGELVMVCHACHASLGGPAAGLSVNATGEFRVPSPEQLSDAASSGEHPNATSTCSWCGKLEHQVKKLLGRSGTALCDECVALASDIMEAELGAGWR